MWNGVQHAGREMEGKPDAPTLLWARLQICSTRLCCGRWQASSASPNACGEACARWEPWRWPGRVPVAARELGFGRAATAWPCRRHILCSRCPLTHPRACPVPGQLGVYVCLSYGYSKNYFADWCAW